MLIVVEKGKLIQNESPGYFYSLPLDRYEQLKVDQILAPLEFYLKDNNGRILTKGNYRGAGDIVNRGGKQFVILGSGNFSYLEEYEIGDVTKESDDFYTGVLWGVYNAFLAYKNKKGVRVYASSTPEPRQELPHTPAAREGVEFGKAEFKRLFGRQKKMRENPTKMSAGGKKVRGSRSFKSPVLQARDEAIEAQIKMFQFEGSYEKLQTLKRVAAEKTAQAAWLLCKEQGVPETRENVISRMQLIDMDAAEVLRGIEAAAAPPAPSFPVRRRKKMKENPAKMSAGVKKKIDEAVHAYRLYIGSHGHVGNAKAEQKLYDRAAKKSESAAIAWLKSVGEEITKWTILNAQEQISNEASRLGGIRPIPGKDY